MRKNRSNRLLPLLADGLTLILLLMGSLLSIQAGYGLPISVGVLLFLGCGLALGVLLLFRLTRFRTLAVVLVLAAWGCWLWQGWEIFVQGALALLNTILAQMGLTAAPSEMADMSSMVLALLTVSVPWGLLTGWSLLRARSAGLTLLMTWLPLIPAFCADGGVSWTALLMMGGASLSCLLSARPAGEEAGAAGARWRLLTLGVSALLLLGLTWLSPEEQYIYPEWADNIRIWFSGQTENLPALRPGEDGLFQSAASPTLSETVDLTRDGSPAFTGASVLRVESSWSGTLYLRGYSLGEYTGTSWEPVPEEAYDRSMPQTGPTGESTWPELLEQWPAALYPAAAQENGMETITVVDLGVPSDWVYTPYQVTGCSGLEPVLDSALSRSDGLWKHSFSFRPPALTDLDSTGRTADAESLYEQFVRENYLQLPDGMAEDLAPYVEQARTLPVSVEGDIDLEHTEAVVAARQVARLLDELAEYDLDTMAPPEGEEFTLWFLEESNQGYCMHFATAGTLLLRTMGIPARYTAGYALPVTAGETTDVPDSAAHAWVEIYLSGYGWYPVEMTPGGGTDLPAENLRQSQQPEENDQTEQELEEPESPEQLEEPSSESTEPAAQTQPGTAPEALAQAEASENSLFAEILSVLAKVLRVGFCLAGLIAALLGGRWLWLRHWEKSVSQPDTNRAVLEIYDRFQALKRWGGTIPEEMTALAQKARFSQHKLTEGERREARGLLMRELRRVWKSLPAWKRLLFRIVWDR
ncbi:MAG: transglutaminaseTgpA domain-containing protein [Candidatus Onthomonas sp.]